MQVPFDYAQGRLSAPLHPIEQESLAGDPGPLKSASLLMNGLIE
jgi:hypothetical protein